MLSLIYCPSDNQTVHGSGEWGKKKLPLTEHMLRADYV